MDEAAALVALETIRTNPIYHAAEVLRRKTVGGSAAMASSAPESDEFRAVLVLISTWDVIAGIIEGVGGDKDTIYEVTPVCHMYDELKSAIEILKEENPSFGTHFQTLSKAHQKWVDGKKKKDASYVSPACSGLHAKFG